MANGEEKSSSNDLYAVLELNKECTPTELRNAYKKLALRWHPDRCSASGNMKFVEEAKKKFQAIQQAYSVLSDANKRYMYDVGAYDSDDDENMQGMGDFLSEMADMMSQTKPRGNGEESFEELQELFAEMFQGDIDAFGSTCPSTTASLSSSASHSMYVSYSEGSGSSNKPSSSEMNFTMSAGSSISDSHYQKFCIGHQQDFKKGKGVRRGVQGGAGNRQRSSGRGTNVFLSKEDGVSAA
ncbi:dnaJ homolog subfamily B member 8-like isoform X2 [Tripterygium wilfordii]|uniref:dnaJ homolog subfamily B member 8-like isoform X2 n=1 Tax=Tripterygium wilfordii TaxID=458696 RepID=UPI0018F7FB31|nr:dnaJ homolog subfamily B member 8-like isoform X2 [Tripterygium wilfordii]